MKVTCNVCLENPTITLPEPEYEDQEIYCPECGKLIATAWEKYFGGNLWKMVWSISNSEYDEDFGGIPVEIIENSEEVYNPFD